MGDKLIPKIVYNLKTILYGPLSALRDLNVCMWHTGRCGSTVIADLINQDGRIHWAGEILEGYTNKIWSQKKIVDGNDSKKQIYRRINKRQKAAGRHPFGFEMKHDHHQKLNVEFDDALKIIKQLRFDKYILLERKNYLRQAVSWRVAVARGKTHLVKGQKRKLVKININVTDEDTLLNGLKSHTQYHKELKEKLPPDFLYLCYEDDIQSAPYKGYSKIMQYLGYTPKELSTKLRKTNPYELSEVIENFDEVSDYLKNTPFHWMITS